MGKLNNEKREQYRNDLIGLLKDCKYAHFRREFLQLHPIDQAEFYGTLEESFRQKLYKAIHSNEMAAIFQALDFEEQKHLAVIELDQQYAANMLNHLYADDAADFLSQLEAHEAEAILRTMKAEEANHVIDLMSYPPKTAGSIMTKEFVSITSNQTVQQVIEQLRLEAPDAETIYYLYVVNDVKQLVGVLSLRDLLTASPNEVIEHLMSSRVISIESTSDQEEVAKLIKKYDLLAAPIISPNRTLLGIVTVDDVMDVIEDETTEDLGEFSASRGATDVNLSAFQAAKLRSPWIIMLMFFGLITAGIIDQYEETLEQIVLLAAFIPLLMDSAGNTGTQSLAVVVRGLALGTIEKKGLLRTLRREFSTGLMIGLLCALVLVLIIPLIYGNVILAIIVGVSVFCSLSIATVIGAIVPLIINKLKLDPAIASGPFITTINDILGLLIYFSIATSLLQYL
ncbi:magnesium transporter [Halalkalibacter wakoensis JCM 9140]|uniref:Magnesium transporter MgtE n=1 Tax=Halalkalibacter wakoensis JCM 9140 TaxID=1236970 RepID=W4Q5P3_9BACI|nr:magnesium transporter [Halalkalibacter wakoensis]GAE27280.1 magnesium transporter [Halalkalibacter wakoensis JCM 9140]